MDRPTRAGLVLAALVLPATARAQPVTEPSAAPSTAPLAQLKDDKQLAQALSAITQDPAVPVEDTATRALAQALMTEGVKQLQAKAYDQALANFLEAYGKFPSPKILLNIASTLRDMGRLADAANTYQRYLLDPKSGAERVAEVKEILLALDAQLTILTVRVFPSGSDISIDGGPFIPIGSSLLTRVRPGIHLVTIRNGDQRNETTVNGFEGEIKEVAARLPELAPLPPSPEHVTAPPVGPQQPPPPPPPPSEVKAPEHVDGWLITGTQYSTDSGTGNARKVRAGYQGPEIAPIVPRYEATDDGEAIVYGRVDDSISSGVLAVMRIDGKFRGFAGGIGLAIARKHLEVDVMFLRSDVTGGYLGGRYRLLTGVVRPYGAVGVPGFVYDEMSTTGDTTTKLAVGIRGAAGVELRINGHFSVQGDLGYEHFFKVEGTRFEADVFVPTLGVIGRL